MKFSVLSENGTLVGTTPNCLRLSGMVQSLLRKQPSFSAGSSHVHLFDDWTLTLMLLFGGYKTKILIDMYGVSSPLLKIISNAAHLFFPKTSFTIGFVAEKMDKNETETLKKSSLKI